MTILGIVGSPRKNGRTNQLVDAALKGAAEAGAETQKVYVIDYDIRQFRGAGGSDDAFTYGPSELARLCSDAEALIVGAPVYWGDINGLTKDFMDTVPTGNANGKPALGLAIAGGTGKGLISGVQSIYHFFYHRQMRGIDPTPVSRFNMEEALGELQISGRRLAEMVRIETPFPGETRDARWPEVLAHYTTLPYLDDGPLEEFLMLARQLIKISEDQNPRDDERVERAQAELDNALGAINAGDLQNAARYAVRSYQVLYYNP